MPNLHCGGGPAPSRKLLLGEARLAAPSSHFSILQAVTFTSIKSVLQHATLSEQHCNMSAAEFDYEFILEDEFDAM